MVLWSFSCEMLFHAPSSQNWQVRQSQCSARAPWETHRDLPPQLQPHTRGVSLCCGYRQEFPWLSAHTLSTTDNCSGYKCNKSRSIYIPSARKPKLSNNRETVLTSPVFVDTVCPLTSHFILSCHYIRIVLHTLCDSWLYIQSEAASNHAQPKDACYSSPRKSTKYKNWKALPLFLS